MGNVLNFYSAAKLEESMSLVGIGDNYKDVNDLLYKANDLPGLTFFSSLFIKIFISKPIIIFFAEASVSKVELFFFGPSRILSRFTTLYQAIKGFK